MGKSKYPNRLDTSVELPVIRDNITELNAEVINNIRDSIIKIQRINPHGPPGNTVADRISKSIDDSGNIRKDALTQANVLSGPIIDADVSKVAAIKESKLKLDFPTRLLQSEISIAQNELNALLAKIEEMNIVLAAHINLRSKNRHMAIAISVDSNSGSNSETATTSLASGTAQDVFQELYDSHINYTGSNISEVNSSHRAEQIFFDKDNISHVIFSDNVQGAITDLADIQSAGLRNIALNLSSNGRIRSGSTTDGFSDQNVGKLLIESTSATYTKTSGSSRTIFSLSTSIASLDTVNEFDLLTVLDSLNDSDNRSYQISKITLSGGKVSEIEVYGGPNSESSVSVLIRVNRPIYGYYNNNGLNTTVRPRNNRTNVPDVVIANPDAATIISSGIVPGKITSSTSSFNITIDGETPININTYDSTQSIQTIETIVNKINEQFVDMHISALAYKIKVGVCYELAISHMLPNSPSDIKNRTIKITEGSLNDASSALGLSLVLDKEIQGSTGNKFHVNGYILSDFGKILRFNDSDLQLITGTNSISLNSGSFKDYGIRVSDTVIISSLTGSVDDGSYRIKEVTDNSIVVDYDDGTFASNIESGSIIHIIRNSASIGELTFEESVSSDGSIIFDVFMDEEKDINYKKRLEVGGTLSSGSFAAAIVDISKGFIVSGEIGRITVGTDGYAYLTGPNTQDGESIFIGVSGVYRLLSSDGLQFVTIRVNAAASPASSVSVDLYGFDEVIEHNYRIARGLFATSLGRILGSTSDIGVPSIIDKRKSGTVDDKIVGESFIERYIEGPRNELRASGIVTGLDITDVADEGTYYTFNVSAGIAVVNGIRYEYPGIIGYRTTFTGSFYIAMDEHGCIIADNEISNPGGSDTYAGLDKVSPFHIRSIAHLGYVDSSDNSLTDLRFFINNIDLTLSNKIIVSKDIKNGHFTSISDAVNYLSRYTGVYNKLGTPELLIGSGVFDISSQIKVDFDLVIRGNGPNTILRKTSGSSLANGIAPSGNNIFMSKALFVVGSDYDSGSSRIQTGVTFRDFTYRSNGLTNVGIAIAITQDLVTSPNAVFRISGINFEGPSNIDGSVADNLKIGEYAVYIGQQDTSTGSPKAGLAMGNLIFSGNYLHKMGLENGAIYFTESSSSTFRDVVVNGNIGYSMSPNVGNTSVTILQIPTTPTSTRFIESGNSVSN
jgi:hypothetical protein